MKRITMNSNIREKKDNSFSVAGFLKTPRLGEKEFDYISRIMSEEAGINLNRSKIGMIESRLVKRLKLNLITSYKEYVDFLRKDLSEREEFINALTTNKTEFFREKNHFEYLSSNCLPDILGKNKNNSIKFWSAACSSGEEVYSIAIALNEFFENKNWELKLLGTDLDTGVLKKASSGIYSISLLENMPSNLLRKYFLKGTGENHGFLKISDFLKENISFKKFNLVKDEVPIYVKFDIIFLRNVLIYFKPDTIEKVIDKMYRSLNKGGYLFIGNSETLSSINHKFEHVASSIYRKNK